ncbi:MAG: preprotein translocase subunit SecA [Nitrospirota bacterium]
MIGTILKKVIGSKNDRELKRIQPIVEKINSLESAMVSLTDADLRSKTDEFKRRIEQGETIEELLPEAFAVVREVARRTLNMRHFDVQLIGGVVLHEGKIAEMKTGEGKTLVATLPVYLNALTGQGVHIVTVNDYLAKRDAAWMGKIYNFIGLSVGVIVHELSDEERKISYNCDITYGTNNEFGFDYLRDNMKFDLNDYVQREMNYAIVDEVDSILIDEARTPLIISGPTEESTDKYYRIDKIIPRLRRDGDYTIEEKTRTVALTEEGNIKVEQLLGVGNLYDPSNMELVHHVLQALRAHTLFKHDVDYVVKDGQVIIVDEFTGRLMPGRRWSDGLHQAIEAKEGVKIANENQTLATITFQNYFRLYKKLAGMTGTADTEAAEFNKIYNLDVVVIPTNMPMIRTDNSDVIYKTEKEKFDAVVNEIIDCDKRGQPALVGTISIEKSERLSNMLKKRGIRHSVLNAKYHEKEAEIIAQAGRSGTVTIATNMAGRGVDIILGGNPEGIAKEFIKDKNNYTEEDRMGTIKKAEKLCLEDKDRVIKAGGLHIIGTERHEARRIDNQLRGRSGRQGDPGSSRFYLSLEDDLLRVFGAERVASIMDRLGMEEGVPIEHRMVTKAIENAQKRVEAHNFDIRKHLLEYDDVMNKQRMEVYAYRKDVLAGEKLKEKIFDMVDDLLDEILSIYCPEDVHPEEWDIQGLKDALSRQFSLERTVIKTDGEERLTLELLRERLLNTITEIYENKEKEIGESVMRHLEKMVMLQIIDSQWKDHLLAMDHLKEGIGLRGYGQRDPLVEYKKEGFEAFVEMGERIKSEVVSRIFRVQVSREQPLAETFTFRRPQIQLSRGDGSERPQTVVKGKKIGRNDPCPCGSGRKYKKCCGA